MESELHVAIHKGQFHDIRLLISAGADVNVRNQEGITPLIMCSFLSQEDWAAGIARMILQNGGLVGIKDKSGRNGLMYAAIFRRIELVKMFLQAVDYDLNETDRFGNSALFYAASTGDAVVTYDIVKRLNHFKLSMNVSNKWGMTPLMEACRLGHKECSSVLRNVGFADETLCDNILGWNAVKWTTEREREIEARQRKRSLYEKPWRENAKGKYDLVGEGLSTTLSSNEGSWPSSRSISVSSSLNSVSTTEPAREGKLPMLKCRRKLKIEKIKRNWIAEVVNKNVTEVKCQPSPIGYAATTADRVPSGTPSRKFVTQTNQSSTLCKSEPWLNNFKQIFRQYELQVTDSYRRAAVAPIKVSEEVLSPSVTTKRSTKEQNDDKKVNDHRNNHTSVRVPNMESKPLSNWPSLSSIASGKKSRTADEIVDIFLGSAKGKRETSLAQLGEVNKYVGGKDTGSNQRKKHNGHSQTKKRVNATT